VCSYPDSAGSVFPHWLPLASRFVCRRLLVVVQAVLVVRFVEQSYFARPDPSGSGAGEPLIVHRRHNQANSQLVMFVHGLNGSRYGTWGSFPNLLFEDRVSVDIGMYDYASGLRRIRPGVSFDLEAHARQVADLVRDLIYDEVVLIGHSMGGLLCKAAITDLLDSQTETADGRLAVQRIIGLFLMATPQAGSLRVPRPIWELSSDAQVLRAHSPLVTKVAERFTDRVSGDGRRRPKLGSVNIRTFAVVATGDKWVDRLSAGLGVPRDHTKNVRGSHTSIVKPTSKDDDLYRWLVTHLDYCFQFSGRAASTEPPASGASTTYSHGTDPETDAGPRGRAVLLTFDELAGPLPRRLQGEVVRQILVGTQRGIDSDGMIRPQWQVHELRAAVAEAAALVRAGDADYMAAVLQMPMSGRWHTERDADIKEIFTALLAEPQMPVWLTYDEPIDVSPWPEWVYIDLPDESQPLFPDGPPTADDDGPRPPRIGNAVRVRKQVAAKWLLDATGNQQESPAMSRPEIAPPDRLPPYSSWLALAIGAPSFESGRAHVARGIGLVNDLEISSRVKIFGIRQDGQLALLPLTPYRGQVVAWRAASTDAEGHRNAGESRTILADEEGLHGRSLNRLREAIDEPDESLAAVTLIRYGRAWIELPEAQQFVQSFEDTVQRFEQGSQAGLWAHYLLALDHALRLNQPGDDWFTDDLCRAAEPHGLGHLYLAEQAEFVRLRGDLARACDLANRFIGALTCPVPGGDAGRVYAEATARFVLGNLLRTGGRYDLAREFIGHAQAAYDRTVPSHAVESFHCRYALSVCDSMAAIFRVDQVSAPAESIVFAQSLVTLANAQAAWFVNDFERARQFASASASGFHRIGYDRHAQRAATVAALIDEWVDLTEGGRPPSTEDDIVPSLVRRVRRVVAVGDGQMIDLSDLRPSRALSVLQFGLRFGRPEDVACTVRLPPVIDQLASGVIHPVTLPAGASLRDADTTLRAAMGIGPDRIVPLAPD
jgi:pimeloyl-ACP methyl ester carboxylesterase